MTNTATLYDNWGCEFLELEQYVTPPPVTYIELPLKFISKTVDEKYIATLNEERLGLLEADVRANGIHNPGTLVYDATKIKLQDGNHRFVVAKRLNLKTFKVNLQQSEGKIQTYGLQYKNILAELLKGEI